MNFSRTLLLSLVIASFLALPGCKLFGDDEKCDPVKKEGGRLRSNAAAGVYDIDWCENVKVRGIIPDANLFYFIQGSFMGTGLRTEWRLPEGASIVPESDENGRGEYVNIRMGRTGGEICARLVNDCSESDWVCKTVRINTSNVWLINMGVNVPNAAEHPAAFTLNGEMHVLSPPYIYAFDTTNFTFSTRAQYGQEANGEVAVAVLGNQAYIANWEGRLWRYTHGSGTVEELPRHPRAADYVTWLSPALAAANGRLYFGLGDPVRSSGKEWWAFNPESSTWQQMADYPGRGRYMAKCFAIQNKVYMVGGGPSYGSNNITYNDSYVYDATSDSWSQMPQAPDNLMHSVMIFDNKAYCYFNSLGFQGQYEFDPVLNRWSEYDVARVRCNSDGSGPSTSQIDQAYNDIWSSATSVNNIGILVRGKKFAYDTYGSASTVSIYFYR